MSPSTSESSGEQAGSGIVFALLDFPCEERKTFQAEMKWEGVDGGLIVLFFQPIFHFSSNLSISQSQEFINLIFHQEKI